VKPLFEALPRLRHLELWSAAPDFTGATALRLEHLTVDPCFDEVAVLSSLGRAQCPALKTLTLSLVDSGGELPAALLESTSLGPLTRVNLDGAFEVDAVRRLLESRLAKHVDSVSVRLPSWLRWPNGSLDWGSSLDRLSALEIIAPHWSPATARALERSSSRIRVRHVP